MPWSDRPVNKSRTLQGQTRTLTTKKYLRLSARKMQLWTTGKTTCPRAVETPSASEKLQVLKH